MDATIAELAGIVENSDDWLAKLRQQGHRMVGCFPLYVPHELIDAAGLVPVDICGGSGEMNAAAEYLQNIVCYPVRNAFERLLTGRLKPLEGAVFASVCAAGMNGGGMWQWLNILPYYHLLTVRHGAPNEHGLAFHKYQVEALKASLEKLAGRAITDEALAQSIKRYNHSRELLDRLAAISREGHDSFSPRDFAVVSAASGLMPRADYVALLTRLLDSLPAGAAASDGRARLVLVGNLCDFPQLDIVSAIHEANGEVVEDDSPYGRRRRLPVREDMPPIDALVDYYLHFAPCPTLYHKALDGNLDYLIKLVESSRAGGIVFVRPKYCDTLGLDYPLLVQNLTKAGIPTLSLDVDGRERGSSQVQTRLQAFIEMVRVS